MFQYGGNSRRGEKILRGDDGSDISQGLPLSREMDEYGLYLALLISKLMTYDSGKLGRKPTLTPRGRLRPSIARQPA
jgi:hypothetical protein